MEAIGEEGQIMRKYYQRRLPEDPSKDYYYIMRETPNTTSLLLEYGFIDNPNDVRKLQNYLLDYVEAVVRAVMNYIGIPYIPPSGSLEDTYTVKAGDTLYSIARKFGLTVDELKALNNLTTNNLSIGQVLIVSEEVNIPPQPEDGVVYTVKPGDTLYQIASQYGVSVADIIELNNLGTTVLTVGQQLLIPNQSTDTTTTYTVKAGDSLWKIANQFGVSVDDLISSNNLNSTTLQIGQVLIIPTGNTIPPTNNNTPSTDNYVNYTVKPGDSLWKIANQYNTSVDAIKQLNNLSTNTLTIGQVLRIPSQEDYTSYFVQRGDSLWSIANRFGTTVNQIRQLNNLTTDTLQIGQLLKIPR